MHEEPIVIKGDSQLVIYQLQGFYKVRAARVIPLYESAVAKLRRFRSVKIEWIPRELNSQADALSRKAYIEALEGNPELQQRVRPYLATEKQLVLLKKLKVELPRYLSRMEASRLITKSLGRSQRGMRKRLRWKRPEPG